MDISVVIPVYNEQENIPRLYEALNQVLPRLGQEYEVILIDDGSQDNTFARLKEIAERDEHIKVIRFRRNFGQTAGMAAGFDYARGKYIICMDGDLQNDPQDIPRLIEKAEEGYDVVSGWRYERKDKYFSRVLPSKIANWLISHITGVYLHDYGCSLKLYRKEVVEHLDLYGEMHRFIPALTSWAGASITEVKVQHHPRRFGKSKYGIDRIIRVILDLLTVKFLLSYSTKPIHIFGKAGFISLIFAGFSGLEVILAKIIKNRDMTGNPLLYLTILLILGGIQLLGMGLLGEMNVRIYHESQRKPIYVIKEIISKTKQ